MERIICDNNKMMKDKKTKQINHVSDQYKFRINNLRKSTISTKLLGGFVVIRS